MGLRPAAFRQTLAVCDEVFLVRIRVDKRNARAFTKFQHCVECGLNGILGVRWDRCEHRVVLYLERVIDFFSKDKICACQAENNNVDSGDESGPAMDSK